MDKRNFSILLIVLGIIALLFPVVSTQTIGVFMGMIVFLLGFGLLVAGILTLPVTSMFGLLSVLFAFVCFILSSQLMFNPRAVSGIVSFIVYFIGFILVVIGLLALVTGFSSFNILGMNTLLFGIITIIVGVFVHDPGVLGAIIGIWLIVSGLLSLYGDKKENLGDKDYIDV